MKDPLWDRLDPQKRTNKRGQRADFPKRVIHMMVVKNHRLGIWQILKGGNQVYEQMDQWYESQTSEELKDLRRCDWVVSAEGQKMRKKYSTTRLDATPYAFAPEDETEVQRLLKKANEDLAPRKDEDFKAMINGEVDASEPATVAPASQPWNAAVEFAEPSTSVSAVTSTSAYAATQPAVAFGPPNVPAAPTPTPSASALVEFSSWLNEQAEFKGASLVQKGIPIIKEFLNGDMNYYKLSPDELGKLKGFITMRLSELRAK